MKIHFYFLLRKNISPVVEGPDLKITRSWLNYEELVEPLLFNFNRPNKTSGLTTGLPTKDATSETIVRNFLVRFLALRVH